MLFQFHSHLLKLRVHLGHGLGHLVEMHGSADAGDDIFTLRVHEIVAVEDLFSRAGVTRKAHARSGVFTRVAKHHLHDVNGRAQQPGDFFHAAVGDGLLRHPGTKHRGDGSPELLHGVVREVLARFFAEVGLVFGDQLFPTARRNRGVFFDSEALLHRAKRVLQVFLGQAHDHGRVHLHEAAIGVISKAFVLGDRGKARDRAVIQAEVQNGFHHAGHGAGRAGADADEQRIRRVAEFLLGDAFERRHVVGDFFF